LYFLEVPGVLNPEQGGRTEMGAYPGEKKDSKTQRGKSGKPENYHPKYYSGLRPKGTAVEQRVQVVSCPSAKCPGQATQMTAYGKGKNFQEERVIRRTKEEALLDLSYCEIT